MKLQLLGTGAADWGEYNPESKISRGRACGLINGNILIDCASTALKALSHYKIDIEKITDILFTHSHTDHFNLDSLCRLVESRKSNTQICVRGPVEVLKQAEVLNKKIRLYPLLPGDEFTIDDMKITALEANHTTEFPSEKALHYFFQTPMNHTFFYALDGAWFLKNTWQFIRKHKIDLIIWDCTIGDTMGDWRVFEHNSIDMIKVMTQTFRKEGVFSDQTQIILSHLARTLCLPHEQLQKKVDPFNFKVAFDGIYLEF